MDEIVLLVRAVDLFQRVDRDRYYGNLKLSLWGDLSGEVGHLYNGFLFAFDDLSELINKLNLILEDE